MVYVVVRLAVFICAAAVVMNVVPGLRLAPYPYFGDPYTTLLAYGIVGIVFGTLHSFVRPIILFVSGRLYIRSLGLIAYLVDTFLFLIVTYLAPTVWQVGDARLFSAMLGAMLMGLIVAGLETLLGLGSPRAVEVRPSAFYWRWLGMLPERQRNQIVERLRTRQIISAIQSYLGDILVELSPLRGFRRFMQRAMYRLRPRLREDSPAVKLRLMLQDLGPTFVKFGRWPPAASSCSHQPGAASLSGCRMMSARFPTAKLRRSSRASWAARPSCYSRALSSSHLQRPRPGRCTPQPYRKASKWW